MIATLCLGSAGSARANGIIDPAMKVLADDFSAAILKGTTFFPNGAGGGVFGFFNPLSQSLTEATFQTTIARNLDQSVIAAAFTCNSGHANPFFLKCGVNYVPGTGTLEIAFWGTATSSPFGTPQLGIPPLPSGCIINPDADGCHPTGHFAVTLSDTFNIFDTDQSGGWSSSKNPTAVFTRPADFHRDSASDWVRRPARLPDGPGARGDGAGGTGSRRAALAQRAAATRRSSRSSKSKLKSVSGETGLMRALSTAPSAPSVNVT